MATTQTETESYADGTALTDVLGDHPKTRILAVFLGDHERDLSPTDIAELAGVDRSTFYRHIDDLLTYGLIEQTRTVGNSTMYQIDKESDAAKKLAGFEWALVDVLEEMEDRDEDLP